MALQPQVLPSASKVRERLDHTSVPSVTCFCYRLICFGFVSLTPLLLILLVRLLLFIGMFPFLIYCWYEFYLSLRSTAIDRLLWYLRNWLPYNGWWTRFPLGAILFFLVIHKLLLRVWVSCVSEMRQCTKKIFIKIEFCDILHDYLCSFLFKLSFPRQTFKLIM